MVVVAGTASSALREDRAGDGCAAKLGLRRVVSAAAAAAIQHSLVVTSDLPAKHYAWWLVACNFWLCNNFFASGVKCIFRPPRDHTRARSSMGSARTRTSPPAPPAATRRVVVRGCLDRGTGSHAAVDAGAAVERCSRKEGSRHRDDGGPRALACL